MAEGQLVDDTISFKGTEYRTENIRAVISVEAGGQMEMSAEATQGSTTCNRQSIPCIPWYCEIIACEKFRRDFSLSRTQLSRQELDAKSTAANRPFIRVVFEA